MAMVKRCDEHVQMCLEQGFYKNRFLSLLEFSVGRFDGNSTIIFMPDVEVPTRIDAREKSLRTFKINWLTRKFSKVVNEILESEETLEKA